MSVDPVEPSESSGTGKRSTGNTEEVDEDHKIKVLSSEEAVEAGSLHRWEE